MGGAGIHSARSASLLPQLHLQPCKTNLSIMPRKPNPVIKAADYKPFSDYIMLKPEQQAEKTEGGIIIPEQARRFLNEGQILKCGPDVTSELKPGMFVTFDSSSEYQLDLGEMVVFVVKESNVILYREDVAAKLFPASGVRDYDLKPTGSPLGKG